MSTSLTPDVWPSADGVWHPLQLAPEALGAGTPTVPDAAIVVAQGIIAWVGAHADLPDAYRQLPQH
jgi:imidazolonepropionase